MAKNFTNSMKTIMHRYEKLNESQHEKSEEKKPTPRRIIIKLLKTGYEEKNLKSSQKQPPYAQKPW